MSTPFHSQAGFIGPSWIRLGRNFALLWSVLVHFDVIVDMLVAAVSRAFPGGPGALPDGIRLAGSEMGIRRGPGETIEAYAIRVAHAHTPLLHKGNPVVLLRQVREYFAAWAIFPVEFINPYGYRITLEVDDSVTRDMVAADDAALAAGQTSKCRLFFRPSVALPSAVDDVRQLVTDWLAGHVRLRAAAVFAGSHVWGEPELVWGDPNLVWNTSDPMMFEVNT